MTGICWNEQWRIKFLLKDSSRKLKDFFKLLVFFPVFGKFLMSLDKKCNDKLQDKIFIGKFIFDRLREDEKQTLKENKLKF
jgi:hypothetical protein